MKDINSEKAEPSCYIFYAILKFLRPKHDCYAKFKSCSTQRNIKTSIKHLIKIINFGAINCPVGRNGIKLSKEGVKCEKKIFAVKRKWDDR